MLVKSMPPAAKFCKVDISRWLEPVAFPLFSLDVSLSIPKS